MNESDEIYALAEQVTVASRKTAKTLSASTGETPSFLHPEIFHFPLASAVLCTDCENVSNGVRACPACGSKALMNISKHFGGGTGGTLDNGGVGAVIEGEPIDSESTPQL